MKAHDCYSQDFGRRKTSRKDLRTPEFENVPGNWYWSLAFLPFLSNVDHPTTLTALFLGRVGQNMP